MPGELKDAQNTWKISVVISTYRRVDRVVRAVESVLAQSVPPIEVIVVNDGFDIEKKRFIEAMFKDKINYYELPWCGRPSVSRHYGVRHSSGDLICFLDDDDYWSPEKLERQLSLFDKSTDPILISGEQSEPAFKGRESVRGFGKTEFPTPLRRLLFNRVRGGARAYPHLSSILVSKALYESCPLDTSMRIHEDWQWFVDLIAEYDIKVAFVTAIVCRRGEPDSEGLGQQSNYTETLNWFNDFSPKWPEEMKVRFVANELSGIAAKGMPKRTFLQLVIKLIEFRCLVPRAYLRLSGPWIRRIIANNAK